MCQIELYHFRTFVYSIIKNRIAVQINAEIPAYAACLAYAEYFGGGIVKGCCVGEEGGEDYPVLLIGWYRGNIDMP